MKYRGASAATAVTVQVDLAELLCPSDAVIKLKRININQATDFQDAQEQGYSVLVKHGNGAVTSGSGGSSVTPAPVETGQPASGATMEVFNTTKMVVGAGTLVTTGSYSWLNRIAFDYPYLEGYEPTISPGNRLTVELGTTPPDSETMAITLEWDEIGG